MDWRWASAAVAVASAAWLLASAHVPARRIVAGNDLGAELAQLEADVSLRPDDAVALRALVETYLEHRAPGLAQAALDRAPAQLRDLPAIADARAQTLAALGRADIALGLQRRVLASCAEEACSFLIRWDREYSGIHRGGSQKKYCSRPAGGGTQSRYCQRERAWGCREQVCRR